MHNTIRAILFLDERDVQKLKSGKTVYPKPGRTSVKDLYDYIDPDAEEEPVLVLVQHRYSSGLDPACVLSSFSTIYNWSGRGEILAEIEVPLSDIVLFKIDGVEPNQRYVVNTERRMTEYDYLNLLKRNTLKYIDAVLYGIKPSYLVSLTKSYRDGTSTIETDFQTMECTNDKKSMFLHESVFAKPLSKRVEDFTNCEREGI